MAVLVSLSLSLSVDSHNSLSCVLRPPRERVFRWIYRYIYILPLLLLSIIHSPICTWHSCSSPRVLERRAIIIFGCTFDPTICCFFFLLLLCNLFFVGIYNARAKKTPSSSTLNLQLCVCFVINFHRTNYKFFLDVYNFEIPGVIFFSLCIETLQSCFNKYTPLFPEYTRLFIIHSIHLFFASTTNTSSSLLFFVIFFFSRTIEHRDNAPAPPPHGSRIFSRHFRGRPFLKII